MTLMRYRLTLVLGTRERERRWGMRGQAKDGRERKKKAR